MKLILCTKTLLYYQGCLLWPILVETCSDNFEVDLVIAFNWKAHRLKCEPEKEDSVLYCSCPEEMNFDVAFCTQQSCPWLWGTTHYWAWLCLMGTSRVNSVRRSVCIQKLQKYLANKNSKQFLPLLNCKSLQRVMQKDKAHGSWVMWGRLGNGWEIFLLQPSSNKGYTTDHTSLICNSPLHRSVILN